MPAAPQAFGFWRGFSALFVAGRSLLSLSRAWPYALVPAAVFTLLETVFVSVSWRLISPWVQAHLGSAGTLASLGATAVTVIAAALAAALGWVLSAFLTPLLSAPALERIVGIVEDELLAPVRAPLGFFAEFWCGVRSLLLSFAVTLTLLLGLSLLELLAPPLVVVTTPLKLSLGALGVAWGLFDYPLTLRGVGARRRFQFMRQHKSVVLGFGAAFAVIFWVPCCGVVMLPVGVAAATQLLWDIERAGFEGSLGLAQGLGDSE